MKREEAINKIKKLEEDIKRLDIEQNAYCISLSGLGTVDSEAMKKLISYSAKKELKKMEIKKFKNLLNGGVK